MNKKQFVYRTLARLPQAQPPWHLCIALPRGARMQALSAIDALNQQREWIVRSTFHCK